MVYPSRLSAPDNAGRTAARCDTQEDSLALIASEPRLLMSHIATAAVVQRGRYSYAGARDWVHDCRVHGCVRRALAAVAVSRSKSARDDLVRPSRPSVAMGLSAELSRLRVEERRLLECGRAGAHYRQYDWARGTG